LQASTDEGSTWAAIWSRAGQQGRNWQNASVNLNAYIGQVVRLRFVGTIAGVRSDMAIDNIGLFDAAAAPSVPGMGDIPQLQVRLYPNPASGYAVATIESPIEQEAELSLVSQLGQRWPLGVMRLDAGQNEVPLPVVELGQGLYLLVVQTRTTRLVERLLIQR